MSDKLQDLLFNISYRLTVLANEDGADDHARLMARAMSLVAGPPSGDVVEAADLDLAKSYASTIAGRVVGRHAHHLQHDVARAIIDTAARLHPVHFKAERSALWLAAQRVLDIDTTSAPSKQDDVAVRYLKAELASVTEQRDVLKRQLEELRADMRAPALPQPKQVDPGGPIWVRVADTTSKYFGLVGRLVGIEHHTTKGECCGIDFPDLDGKDHAWNRAEAFAVIGTGRQGPGPNDAPKPQYHGNGESLRAVATAAGATDCNVFVDDGQVTLVVDNLRHGKTLQHVANAVFDLVPMLDTKTYVVRTAGPIGERREVRSTPEDRSRAPRS